MMREISKVIQRNLPQGTGTKVGTSHPIFFDLDIIRSNGEILTKLYDKRVDFPFFIEHIPIRVLQQESLIYFLRNCEVRDPSYCKIDHFHLLQVFAKKAIAQRANNKNGKPRWG